MISERMSRMNSLVFGGQPPEAIASARMRPRSARSAYGQTWTTWLSGPISVYQKAASSENLRRFS
ncbi:hypothetical protein D3C83_103190 [compost metagenome]